jgi:hypothetical protein
MAKAGRLRATDIGLPCIKMSEVPRQGPADIALLHA